MWEVAIHYFGKDWQKRYKSNLFEPMEVVHFNLRREAKNWVETQLAGKEALRHYHRGTRWSVCTCWLDEFYTDEETGEECQAFYEYYIKRLK